MEEKKNKPVQPTESNDLMISIFDEPVIIESYGSITHFRIKFFLFYFLKLVVFSFLFAIPSVLVGAALSFLPWGNDYVMIFVMFLAMILFGGFIVFYLIVIYAKAIWNPKRVLVFLGLAFFWPIVLMILLLLNVRILYYYLDFLYFFFGFLPMSLFAGWIINQKATVMTILFGIAEFITICGALSYAFFLFPIFTHSNAIIQLFWVIFFHPIFFELFLSIGPRILVKLQKDTNPNMVVLITHAMFHNATIGRMVLFCINETWVLLVAIFVTSVIEYFDRMTLFARDKILLNQLKKKFKVETEEEIDEEKDTTISSHILNIKMVIELSGIQISFAMMMFFVKFGLLFSFNRANQENMIISLFLQIFFAIVINLLCSAYEIRHLEHDLLVSFQQLFKLPFILFITYGNCIMGLIGMIYVTLQESRPLTLYF